MTGTTDVEALAAELAIRRVLAEYCHACDDGEYDQVAELFCDGGRFGFAGSEVAAPVELAEWLAAQALRVGRGKHVMSNIVIDVVDARADVVSDYVFLRRLGDVLEPMLAGRYRDRFVCQGEVWKIERRDADVMRDSQRATDASSARGNNRMENR